MLFFLKFFSLFNNKKFFLFGFKSTLVAHGFWPRYLDTPEKMFNIMVDHVARYKNPNFFPKKVLKKKNTTYVFSIVIKKKKNFFLDTFFFFKKNIFFHVSNLIKLFVFLSKKAYTVFFIRKQKFFNKGRYSRNRQLYRTGVYWCIYVNLLAVLGLNYLFYKFTVNFLQYWWFFFAIMSLFIFPYFFKSSFYSYFKNLFSFKEYVEFSGISFIYNYLLGISRKLFNDFNYFIEALVDDFY